MVAGVLLLAVGLGATLYWWVAKARYDLEAVQHQNHEVLSDRVLNLAARMLQDYVTFVLAKLSASLESMRKLHAIAREELHHLNIVHKQWQNVPVHSGVGNTAYLTDWGIVEKEAALVYEQMLHSGWARELKKDKVDLYGDAVTALLIEKMWISEREWSPELFLHKIQEESQAQSEAMYKSRVAHQLYPNMIVQKIDELSNGLHWQWLWNHAQPLGVLEGESLPEFTTVICAEQALLGGTGRSSPYWGNGGEGWLDIYTRLPYEILCIRGLFSVGGE